MRELSPGSPADLEYSFCTLVTRLSEYQEMVTAFAAKGFTAADCEFIYVDNSIGNRFDAFSAYNRFLQEAKGRYIVLCHQDILPISDDRARLDLLLKELNDRDGLWALAGNAGALDGGGLAVRISHPDSRTIDHGGPFPVKVMSLDENFIVVRRDANLALSRDLGGFHWYGADLCIIASLLGWNIYVIDFHLLHNSTGNTKGDFRVQSELFRKKYAAAFRPRWHQVPTSRPVYLSASPLKTFFARASRKVKSKLFAWPSSDRG